MHPYASPARPRLVSLAIAMAMAMALAMALALAACASVPAKSLRVSGDRLFIPVTVNGVRTEALLDSGRYLVDIEGRRTGISAVADVALLL